MTSTEEELLSLDFYARKTFFKTASLMANSCKAIAVLGGQSAAVAQLAHDYGRHLGLAFQARAAPPSMFRLCLSSRFYVYVQEEPAVMQCTSS